MFKILNNNMDSFKDFMRHSEKGYSNQEVVSLYLGNPDKKLIEIAFITKKSIGEIYRILHASNVQPNRLRANHHIVMDFATAGVSIPQIAELTGYTSRNVRYILSKLMERNV